MTFPIVTLSKYPDITRSHLIESYLKLFDPKPPLLVVADGHNEDFGVHPGTVNCKAVIGYDRFCFARNANFGLRYFMERMPDAGGIILCNDDVSLTDGLPFDVTSLDRPGIVGCLVDGGVGNPHQKFPTSVLNHRFLEIRNTLPICFVAVWLNRAMIQEIGPMDETFQGYGFDDNDYCIRARKAGWRTYIDLRFHVKHGSGGEFLKRGENWSLSFARQTDFHENTALFLKKHA